MSIRVPEGREVKLSESEVKPGQVSMEKTDRGIVMTLKYLFPTSKALLQSGMPKGQSQPEKHERPDPRVMGTRNGHPSNSTMMSESESLKDIKVNVQKQDKQ
ncbi:hypothetical protein STEG23_010731 [Scotinomys teguina]